MMSDSWRLAIGTFTRLPVPAPRRVDRTIAGRAMSLGPLVGALMAAVSGIPLLAVGVLAMGVLAAGTPGSLSLSLSLLAAVLTVGAQAWLTRGLHLDGLADTADGLGGGTSPERAQAIARASDIGPFGVIAVVLVLMCQIAALAVLGTITVGADIAAHASDVAAPLLAVLPWASWVLAGALARGVAMIACTRARRSLPAARPDGLGHLVAQSAPPAAVVSWLAVLLALSAACSAIGGWTTGPLMCIVAAASVVAGLVMITRAARRFGGLTGDILGAGVEVATTAALLSSAVLAALVVVLMPR